MKTTFGLQPTSRETLPWRACSPLNMALFLADENVSPHAGVKVPAGQRDSGSPKHWAVVGTDVGYARLLSGQRAADTGRHNTTMQALKTNTQNFCFQLCRKCSHHDGEAGHLSGALDGEAAFHFALVHLQSDGEVLVRCGFFLNLTHQPV